MDDKLVIHCVEGLTRALTPGADIPELQTDEIKKKMRDLFDSSPPKKKRATKTKTKEKGNSKVRNGNKTRMTAEQRKEVAAINKLYEKDVYPKRKGATA